jgi:hypothetical protein
MVPNGYQRGTEFDVKKRKQAYIDMIFRNTTDDADDADAYCRCCCCYSAAAAAAAAAVLLLLMM